MVEVLAKLLKGRLGFLGGALWWQFPFFPWRVCPAREIHSIPELPVHPLAGVIEDADQSATVLPGETLRHRGDGFLRGLQGVGLMQVHAGVAAAIAHVVDIERAAEPERLVVQADVRSFVHVARHAGRRDADFRQGGVRLWRP